MNRRTGGISILLLTVLLHAHWTQASEPIKVLIVDGQNNHDWRSTTPVMAKALQDAKIFTVDVATSPPEGSDLSGFRPNFSAYDVVLSNYNGQRWPGETEQAFLEYVRGGGGFVVVHAADNAFSDWPEYNEMIGLGGWGGRNERSGPYVFYRDGQFVRDTQPGPGGSHGPQHEFQIVIRDSDHPITQRMPQAWLHAKDELYDSLRGPAVGLQILATAYSEQSGKHEPMIMTVQCGQGRVFHTPMGHADYSLRCSGFIATLQRGTEWAATGQVTLGIPDDFPTATESRSRP